MKDQTSTANPPPLADFIDSVEAMRENPNGESLSHGVARALKSLLAEPDWLSQDYRQGWPDRYRQHILHVAPDGGFSVVALVWQPGQTTPIHDHLTWCVVGVYEGEEEETLYHLYKDAKGRFFVRAGIETANPGDVTVLVPPEEDVHQVTNVGDETAISIHVYGADIGKLGSSINCIFESFRILPEPGDAQRVPWRR
ncbi:MAG: cysteine dioxygenase family protein [Rubrobacter sp.]|nr:cysteine dioxygenase family protein [Rubrobacter sp.]